MFTLQTQRGNLCFPFKSEKKKIRYRIHVFEPAVVTIRAFQFKVTYSYKIETKEEEINLQCIDCHMWQTKIMDIWVTQYAQSHICELQCIIYVQVFSCLRSLERFTFQSFPFLNYSTRKRRDFFCRHKPAQSEQQIVVLYRMQLH